jgi:hypothetical protein
MLRMTAPDDGTWRGKVSRGRPHTYQESCMTVRKAPTTSAPLSDSACGRYYSSSSSLLRCRVSTRVQYGYQERPAGEGPAAPTGVPVRGVCQ